MEYLEIGGEHHGEVRVAVVLQDHKLTMFERSISVEKENIEYIED